MRLRLGIIALLVGTVACSGSAAGGLPNLLLPDLDQRPPLAVSVRWGGPPKQHPLLVFTSSVENVGYGPLIVEGRRASRRVPTMRANQLIALGVGSFSTRDRSRAPALQRQPFPQPLAPAAVRALRAADSERCPDGPRSQERFLPEERPPLAEADARPGGAPTDQGQRLRPGQAACVAPPRRHGCRVIHPRQGGAGNRHQRRPVGRLRPRRPRQRRSTPARGGLLERRLVDADQASATADAGRPARRRGAEHVRNRGPVLAAAIAAKLSGRASGSSSTSLLARARA
jgi:hypothetical protein